MGKRIRIFGISAAFLFFGLLIIFGGSRPVAFFRLKAAQIALPLTRAAVSTVSWIGFDSEGLSSAHNEVFGDDLREVALLRARIEELEAENRSLSSALGMKSGFGAGLKGARVLQYQNMLGRESLLTDLGSESGAREGDVVMDENRLLIGEVSEAGFGFSKIAIASNSGITFSGELLPLGGKVLVKGIGSRTFVLELIPGDTPVRAGDFVVWTREDQRTGPSIFAGRVAKNISAGNDVFQTGHAVLLSDPEVLERVMILTKP